MNVSIRSFILLSLLFIVCGQFSYSQNYTYWRPNIDGNNTKEPDRNSVQLKIMEAGSEKLLSVKDDNLTVKIDVDHTEYEFETKWDGRSSVNKLTGRTRTVKTVVHNEIAFFVYESTSNISVTISRPGYMVYTTTIAPHFIRNNARREEKIYFPPDLKIVDPS